MPSFEYHAYDTSGKRTKGFVDADSSRQARQVLRDQKLLPISVESASANRTKPRRLFGSSISNQHLSIFTQQFAVLIQSGASVEDALQATADQTNHLRFQSALRGVKAKVREGLSLAEGMKEYSDIFPSVYIELIAAGEQAGELSTVLLQLSGYLERKERLREIILQASVYPIVLTLVSLSVIGLLMAYVVPKVVEQFEDVGQQLPTLTKIMIMISDFVVHDGLAALIFIIVLVSGFGYIYRNAKVKLRLHRNLFHLPLVSNVMRNLETARMLNTLSIMLSSGVPLLDALSSSANTTNNLFFKKEIQNMAERIREGGSLNQAMKTAALFPPLAVFMVANGEMSGELAKSLQQASQQQENQLNSVIAVTTRLIEPFLIIIFGMIVLAIVLAILLPIMQLNNLAQL
ncbi:MAG: type II secretion system inner membrane protein GspF [Neptuniibacter sp.]